MPSSLMFDSVLNTALQRNNRDTGAMLTLDRYLSTGPMVYGMVNRPWSNGTIVNPNFTQNILPMQV